jgi:transposase
MIAQDRQIVIGADVHKVNHVVTAMCVDEGEYCHPAKQIGANEHAWREYIGRFPGCRIHVVYEAGPDGYNLHDWIERIRERDGIDVRAEIAPPAQVPKAPAARNKKTDKRDSVSLIHAKMLKSYHPVVVPVEAKREERQLMRSRKFLVKQEVALKSHIRGALRFQGICEPPRRAWSRPWIAGVREAAAAKDTTGFLKDTLDAFLDLYMAVKDKLKEINKRMKDIVNDGHSNEVALRLKELVGIGEVADFTAFRNSEAFASYAGLVPGERSSGEQQRQGRTTRACNHRLKALLVECAWVWLQHDPEAKRIFSRIKAGVDKRKYIAIVALARRLAVKVYHKALDNPPHAAA